jgi:molybdenum cofactor cytidylyltransferase
VQDETSDGEKPGESDSRDEDGVAAATGEGLNTRSSTPPISGILLAAGASRRMRTPKQFLQFRGASLLRHAVLEGLAASLSRLLVVVGAHAEPMKAALAPLGVEIVENPNWARGQGSSVAAGVRALRERAPETAAVVFLLADQPLLTAASLDRLIAVHRATGAPIVASRWKGRLQAPALFSFTFFDELEALQHGAGARAILRRHEDVAIGVELPEAGLDVDTFEDYERLLALDAVEKRP